MTTRTDHWQHRMEIKSETSSRIYVVAQRISTSEWECSCPGWKSHRHCKHLASMGLASRAVTAAPRTRPARGPARGDSARSFSDAAYRHYDTSGGFGSADEWIAIAEQMASGKTRYQRPARPVRTCATDMRLLGLEEMPPDVKDLTRAMRRRAMTTHPDHGGSEIAFREMFAAYERLLRMYR